MSVVRTLKACCFRGLSDSSPAAQMSVATTPPWSQRRGFPTWHVVISMSVPIIWEAGRWSHHSSAPEDKAEQLRRRLHVDWDADGYSSGKLVSWDSINACQHQRNRYLNQLNTCLLNVDCKSISSFFHIFFGEFLMNSHFFSSLLIPPAKYIHLQLNCVAGHVVLNPGKVTLL